MTQHRATEAAIRDAVKELEATVEFHTDKTLVEVRQLEEVNRAHVQRYAKLNQAAAGLDTDGIFIQDTGSEIAKYVEQVDEVAIEVTRLQALVAEMDEWSKELSIKVQRL